MKPSKNHLKIRCDLVKEVVTEGGIVIPIQQGREFAGAKTYKPQLYAPTHGAIESIGEGVTGFEVGDVATFHFTTEETLRQQGKITQEGEYLYFFLEASKVICYERGGIVHPTEGWVLARRAEKPKEVTDGGIIIPEAHRKQSDRKFVVCGVAEGYEDCSVGDVILTEKDCDIPLQPNELLGIKDSDIFRIKTENILAVEHE